MALDPFFQSLWGTIPNLGRAHRPAPVEPVPEAEEALAPVQEEKAKPKAAKLSGPKWEQDAVGFNEDTPVSVLLDLLGRRVRVVLEAESVAAA